MSSSPVWRDRLLLLSAWIVVLLFAMGIWTFSPHLNQVGPGLPMALAAGSLLLVIFFSLTSLRRDKFAKFLGQFRSRTVFALLLLALAIGEIYYIFADVGTFSIVSFIMLIIAIAALLHLTVGRETPGTKVIVLSIVWFICIVLVRQSLSQLLAVGSFWSATWRYMTVVLGLTVFLTLLIILPIVLLNRRLSGWAAKIASRLPRHSGRFFLPALGASLLFMLWNQLTDFELLQVVILGRISIVLAMVFASIYALGNSPPAEQEASTGLVDLRRRAYTWGLAAIALGFLLVSSQISGDLNPDAIAYFAVARNYAEGNFVVRGTWSPLISWLMAPAIAQGANPLTVHVVLNQLAALLWMLMTVLIAHRWGVSRYGRMALAFLVLLLSLAYGFFPITPDLLGAAVFSVGFYVLTDPRLADKPVRNGVIFGIVIGLSYYAKYYNLAFFIALIPFLFLLLIARGETKANSLKVVLSSLATAALLSLPWIIGIWSRYGEVTITTSAAINRAYVGPNSGAPHPCWRGLCDAPPDVLFPWEDPQLQSYVDIGWSPFESVEMLRHQIRLLWNNALPWIGPTPIGPRPIPPVFLVALILLPLISWNNAEKRYQYSMGLVAFSLYAAGYQLTYASPVRYYLPIIPIAWLAAFILMEEGVRAVFPRSLPPRTYPILIAMIFAISILAFSWLTEIQLRLQHKSSTCLEEAAEIMAEYLVPPTAGSDTSINYVAYYTGIPTRGVIPPNTPASDIDSQLRNLGVRTLVTPAEAELVETLTTQHDYSSVQTLEVCGGMFEVLRIP